MSTSSDDRASDLSDERLSEEEAGRRLGEEIEEGSLDPDELEREAAWWDEGSDDEG